MAELLAFGDLGEFEEGRGRAVGIEHFGAVELAVAIDRGEGPVVGKRPFGSKVEIVDFAVEAELVIAQRRTREGRAAQIGVFKSVVAATRRTGEGREAARNEGRTAIALLVVGADQVDRQIGCRRVPQRGAHAELVLRVEFLILACGKVFDIAVARAPFEGDAPGQHVRTGIEEAAEQRLVEIAVTTGDLAREAFARTRGHEADRADRRSGAEQRRLRALDHFDALEVVDRLVRTARSRDIDPVVIERDARPLLRGTRIRGDPADNDAGIVGALLLDVEPGHVARQFVEIGNPEILDPLAGHGRNRDRDVLRALFDLLRRDHDGGGGDGVVSPYGLLRQQGSGDESDRCEQGAAKSRNCHERPLSKGRNAGALPRARDSTAAEIFQK